MVVVVGGSGGVQSHFRVKPILGGIKNKTGEQYRNISPYSTLLGVTDA